MLNRCFFRCPATSRTRLTAGSLGGAYARLTKRYALTMVSLFSLKFSYPMHHILHRYCSRLTVICCGLLIVLCPTLAVLHDIHRHNVRLAAIATRVFTIPLPERSERLASSSSVANSGSGDACDYIIEQTIQTELSLEAIRTFYGSVQVQPSKKIDRGVVLPTSARYYRISLGGLVSHLIVPVEQEVNGKLTFVLQATEGRDDAGFDLRCM